MLPVVERADSLSSAYSKRCLISWNTFCNLFYVRTSADASFHITIQGRSTNTRFTYVQSSTFNTNGILWPRWFCANKYNYVYSWFSSRPTILVFKKVPSMVSSYLKLGIDLTMHSLNAWHVGGICDRILGRISSPRNRTRLTISLVYPIMISLGNVRFFTSVDGKDFRNYSSSCFLKILNACWTFPWTPCLPTYLIIRSKVYQ